MPPHHKPLLNSQLRRTRLAGLTLHVCRFREEESTHAASRRERPQNSSREKGCSGAARIPLFFTSPAAPQGQGLVKLWLSWLSWLSWPT